MGKRLAAAGVAISLLATTAAHAETPYEQAVLANLNAVRGDPPRYADQLRQYGSFFHANVVVLPGSNVRYRTKEGRRPVEEAASYVLRAPPLAALFADPALARVAASHVQEQARTGATGHQDSLGRMPEDRIRAVGGGGTVAEVIAYGAISPADVIRQLIVDDGVPDRGHRTVLFADPLRYAGVACGPHPVFRTMCVIDFAGSVSSVSHPIIAAVVARARNSAFGQSMHRVLTRLAFQERLRRAKRRVGEAMARHG